MSVSLLPCKAKIDSVNKLIKLDNKTKMSKRGENNIKNYYKIVPHIEIICQSLKMEFFC